MAVSHGSGVGIPRLASKCTKPHRWFTQKENQEFPVMLCKPSINSGVSAQKFGSQLPVDLHLSGSPTHYWNSKSAKRKHGSCPRSVAERFRKTKGYPLHPVYASSLDLQISVIIIEIWGAHHSNTPCNSALCAYKLWVPSYTIPGTPRVTSVTQINLLLRAGWRAVILQNWANRHSLVRNKS